MIRKIAIALITLATLSSGTAWGALEIVEDVAELEASGIRLPTGSAGQVVYRDCSGCDPVMWSVDGETTYHVGVNTAPVPLAKLRQAVTSDNYELIYVFYAPETGTVTRVVLDLTQVSEGTRRGIEQ